MAPATLEKITAAAPLPSSALNVVVIVSSQGWQRINPSDRAKALAKARQQRHRHAIAPYLMTMPLTKWQAYKAHREKVTQQRHERIFGPLQPGFKDALGVSHHIKQQKESARCGWYWRY